MCRVLFIVLYILLLNVKKRNKVIHFFIYKMQLKNVLRAAETELHWVLDSARHNWLRDPV